MKYLEKIGNNSKVAFRQLNLIDHKKIKQVLETYNKLLLSNNNKIIKENTKDVKNCKRKNFIERLILDKKKN